MSNRVYMALVFGFVLLIGYSTIIDNSLTQFTTTVAAPPTETRVNGEVIILLEYNTRGSVWESWHARADERHGLSRESVLTAIEQSRHNDQFHPLTQRRTLHAISINWGQLSWRSAIVLGAALLATLFFRWLVRQRRTLPGHCSQCGYDLRAFEHSKCPECGTEVRSRFTTPSGV